LHLKCDAGSTIHVDLDTLSAAARLLESRSRPGTARPPLPLLGRPPLDRALSAASAAWNAAPSDADGRELATRVRLARDDATTMEEIVLALLRTTGEGLPA